MKSDVGLILLLIGIVLVFGALRLTGDLPVRRTASTSPDAGAADLQRP